VYAGAALGPVTSVVDYHKQPALAAVAPAVPTELPVAQAISPAANIPATRNDSRKADKSTPSTSRSVIVDPQTNTLVYRSLDATTGNVIDQVPARALLRQRAYVDAQAVQALIAGKDVTTAVVAAEQNVDTTT
jgi:hypothetical protein